MTRCPVTTLSPNTNTYVTANAILHSLGGVSGAVSAYQTSAQHWSRDIKFLQEVLGHFFGRPTDHTPVTSEALSTPSASTGSGGAVGQAQQNPCTEAHLAFLRLGMPRPTTWPHRLRSVRRGGHWEATPRRGGVPDLRLQTGLPHGRPHSVEGQCTDASLSGLGGSSDSPESVLEGLSWSSPCTRWA